VDAPVTGGAARAEQGDLVVLVGGEGGLLEELRPILGALGSSVVHCGTSVGDGQAVKMVNQLLVGIHLAAAGEALAYAEALGLNPRSVFETVKQGAANSFMLEHRGETMLSRDFTPRGSKLQVLIKDMGFVVESAERYGFTASLATSANEIYQRASDLGFGDEEDAGIVRMFGRSQTDSPKMKD
jgi:3-hydroxyisobutyrate dehydrogenase